CCGSSGTTGRWWCSAIRSTFSSTAGTRTRTTGGRRGCSPTCTVAACENTWPTGRVASGLARTGCARFPSNASSWTRISAQASGAGSSPTASTTALAASIQRPRGGTWPCTTLHGTGRRGRGWRRCPPPTARCSGWQSRAGTAGSGAPGRLGRQGADRCLLLEDAHQILSVEHEQRGDPPPFHQLQGVLHTGPDGHVGRVQRHQVAGLVLEDFLAITLHGAPYVAIGDDGPPVTGPDDRQPQVRPGDRADDLHHRRG